MNTKNTQNPLNRINLSILENELIISTSRSGGPGGQHVNKTETRVSLSWHIASSQAITLEQKELLLKNLHTTLTDDGHLIVTNNSTRSQLQNKTQAYNQLLKKIEKALYKPKKRIKTNVPTAAKEKRLQTKKLRSLTKKLRSSYD